jgi:hypothetical protein
MSPDDGRSERQIGVLYEDALMDLGVFLNGTKDEFKRRVRRLLVEKRDKLIAVALDGGIADGTVDPKPSSFQITKLMHALLVAAREQDADLLSVVEHACLS